MNILHTSDWHLGQRFFDRDRHEEHQAFLDHLLGVIEEKEVGLLIVAGDIFDTANPPRDAEKLYFSFLTRLAALGHCKAIIVGGNHDSAPHLDAPAPVLDALSVTVIGAMPEHPQGALIYVPEMDESESGVWVAAVPYLRDRDVRKAVAGESFDELSARTRAGIRAVYADMAELAKAKEEPVIATGHLTALGSSVGESDSERSIHIGNLGSISGGDFSDVFSYVALGHIHTPQAVGGRENVRYSGSPIALSFGERNQTKELRLIHLSKEGLTHEALEVPAFRRLERLKGTPGELEAKLEALGALEHAKTPWVELVLESATGSSTVSDELRVFASEHGVDVLKVGVSPSQSRGHALADASVSISEMKPLEVFEKRLDEADDDIDRETLTQCFLSLLEKAQEGEDA